MSDQMKAIDAVLERLFQMPSPASRRALMMILDKYLEEELATWAKRFPDRFYDEMFRLRNWQWNPISLRRPSVIAKYINDLIYERLSPDVLYELKTGTPNISMGKRQQHKQITEADIGHPALAKHLHSVIGFMRTASTWKQFMSMMNRTFPKKGGTAYASMTDK